jgi:PKHD-type hydroxylase
VIVRLPDLLDAATVKAALDALRDAAWEDGKGSAHGKAKDVKNTLVLPLESKASQAAGRILLERLASHEGFKAAALPKVILPPKFSRYDTGMAYGNHLDLPMMGTASGAIRTDISLTVFLTDDYEGGDLVFESDYGVHRVHGKGGEAVLYPASTLHRVEPVTKGSRVVALSWIQSMVRDPAQRRILFDLAQVATAIDGPEREKLAVTLRKSQYNLLRMWGDQ